MIIKKDKMLNYQKKFFQQNIKKKMESTNINRTYGSSTVALLKF